MVAHRLRSQGIKATLIEQGAIPGGRVTTHHEDGATFDIGAQFITTRERIFRSIVEKWVTEGIVKPWYKGPLGNMRYVGVDGMSSVAKHLSKDLNIIHSETATHIHFSNGEWTVTTSAPNAPKKINHHTANFLVVSIPVPKALQLIDDSNVQLDFDEEDELRKITYSKCITALTRLAGPSGLPNPGAMDLNLDALRWLGDNSTKGISKVDGCLTISSSPRFAAAYWDAPEEQYLPLMMNASKPFIRADIVSATSHKWEFSEPTRIYKEKQPFRENYLVDASNNLAMCGDGFAGGRLEAAAMSGYSLGEELIRAV